MGNKNLGLKLWKARHWVFCGSWSVHECDEVARLDWQSKILTYGKDRFVWPYEEKKEEDIAGVFGWEMLLVDVYPWKTYPLIAPRNRPLACAGRLEIFNS